MQQHRFLPSCCTFFRECLYGTTERSRLSTVFLAPDPFSACSLLSAKGKEGVLLKTTGESGSAGPVTARSGYSRVEM